ncbi:PilC family type IV pilus tip adhesin [Neisseria gonorrhoeae]
MNKTLKRRVFRHTALYAAILMFSHTGGGGAMAETRDYAIIMNGRNQPEVKSNVPSSIKDKDRRREYTYYTHRTGGGSVSFNNNDTLVSQQSGTAVFGTATYLPPYGKVSGFDADALKERANAAGWIRTTRIALAGYSYAGIHCGSISGCPKLVYKTRFSFDNPDLAKTGSRLNRHTEPSRDNSPIYKLKDYPWLGVSFNLGAEGTAKDGKVTNKLVSSFDENNSNSNQNLVYTTEGHNISLGNWQRESTAMAYYLNAKLHLMDKKKIENIAPGKTVQLGILKPSIDVRTRNTGLGLLNFWAKWDIKDNGQIPVKLGLPEVKAGRCINEPNPNKNTQAPSPALTAPALWFGPVQNGKVQMYSASVSTYPGSSSSRIFLQELKTKTDPGRPGRHSLAALNERDIKSREPNFNSRQTVIRLPGGVYKINPGKSGGRVAGINGNDGKNDTFGIFKDRYVTPETDEWSEMLLPWTARYYGNDTPFQTSNKPNNQKKYSQKYRIRTKEDDNDKPRDLGDIVNSPIVAVDGYLATAANDGMVHIFKKNGGSDERSYNLKLSYIPGTMPRQDFDNDTSALKDSTLAQELRTFAEKGYVGDRYGVDGGFVLRRITDDQDRQKHFFMFGAMGLGGRGAYALDLSKIDSSNLTGVSMFDVQNDKNKNDNNRVELGYTVGTPQIGKTQNGKYAAFLASGYAAKDIASQENKTALYVYDLENGSGSLIKKIEAPGGKGGLSSPTLVDKDLDGIVDIAYAGDRGGNMYRFDLSDSDSSKWSVSTIFEGGKPITSAPAVSRLADKRVVIFGTGSDLSEEDVLNTDEQYIYGIFDDDEGTVNVKVTNGTGGRLLEQTLTKENNTLFLSNNKASGGSADKGWVVKLMDGERVTVKPTVVLRTAFVTIRKYTDTDKCGAQTAILGINTADGGALTPRSARPIVPDNQVAQYSGHQKMNGKSIPIGCMWKNGKTVCPNGYVYDKPVNVRYLDEKKTDDFPVTADGDAGGSGTFKEGKKPARNNRCFSGKGVRTLLMNDLDSLDITGPMCGIKRLSWREVFF